MSPFIFRMSCKKKDKVEAHNCEIIDIIYLFLLFYVITKTLN